MRLLVVTNGLPPTRRGGAEWHAYSTSTALAQRHDVVVLSGTSTYEDVPFPVQELPLLPYLEASAPPARKATWHLRDQWRPAVFRRVAEKLDEFRPEVVITHNIQGLSASVFTALSSRRARHLHFAHDLSLLCVRASMTKGRQPCTTREPECLLQRRVRGGAAARRLDLLVAPSSFVRDRHVDFGVVPADRSLVIRHGVTAPQPRLRTRGQAPLRLGFLGTLAEFKGIRTLLRCVGSGTRDVRLTVAGSGPLQALVEDAARRDDRIAYLGHVSGARKDKFFDDLDVLVVPSEWEESSGLVVVEASARGLPSIVSDRGGLPEHYGVRTFRAGDERALGDAIDWLASRDRLRQRSEALVAARASFSWERHVDELESALIAVSAREQA